MTEEWRDVVGYEGLYKVSNKGNVYSVPRPSTKGGYMKQIDMSGYLRVILSKNGKTFNAGVHRLVAQAFIKNIENKPSVNHIDGDKHNNCIENLEWSTWEEQIEHSLRIGLRKHICNNIINCWIKKDNNIVYFTSLKDLSIYFGHTKSWATGYMRRHGNNFIYNGYEVCILKDVM